MRIAIGENELRERIALNFKRFDDPYYRIEGVFQDKGADWPGDKEGRALLAFVSHYKISGEKIPCMDELLAHMPEHTNFHLFFDAPEYANGMIHEQQLSGHSWLLRGLCEHYQVFGDDFSLKAIHEIVENLYLPLLGKYREYPTKREGINKGGVSGSDTGIINGWVLSSDTGCAFMSIDGLSHAYEVTRDIRVLALLEEMAYTFANMDKAGMKLQTHCTLTAARGLVRLFKDTGNGVFFEMAKNIYTLYTEKGGMTLTYQNLNWWGRPDTWTEPCAIVDSLMLAMELFKLTGNEEYRTTAVRIYINGLATAQRPNGGAGTDKIVLADQPMLYADMPEAFFCCTMRLAEGLWYVWENRNEMIYEESAVIKRDNSGRYLKGDVILCEPEGELASKYSKGAVTVDGHRLVPLIKYYNFEDDIYKIKMRVVFSD